MIKEDYLQKLYQECIKELNTIGLKTEPEAIGEVTISIARRACKRYGCCKQEQPEAEYRRFQKIGTNKKIIYEKFNKHSIEISSWVMQLNKKIIKNTIMHEIIHCFPYCNNHGKQFREYANKINKELGYHITRLGNKQKDYLESKIEYKEESQYKYQIECKKCGKQGFRQRCPKNFSYKYRCARCGGKLNVNIISKSV